VVSFNIYEAKTQLSKLLRRVRAGEEVVIADAGTPIARLVPIDQAKGPRTLGTDRGKIWVAPDAFDPLSGDDLAAWDGALFPNAPGRSPAPAPPSASPRPRRTRARPAHKARR
jgi:prevent-host-death family protein